MYECLVKFDCLPTHIHTVVEYNLLKIYFHWFRIKEVVMCEDFTSSVEVLGQEFRTEKRDLNFLYKVDLGS